MSALFFLLILFHKVAVLIAYQERPLLILAIGDSLTAGYYHDGRDHHPYAARLSTLFMLAKIPAVLHQRGVSGERVVSSMRQRLEATITTRNRSSYDWIIILGGTNDLKHNATAQTIFHKGLKPMYELVRLRTNGCTKLVVMTVPEKGYISPRDIRDKERQELNKMIRSYVSNHKDQNKVCLVDIDKAIPYHDLKDSLQRNLIWDDKVHLTPTGYDFIAELVFEVITNKLEKRDRNIGTLRLFYISICVGIIWYTLISWRHISAYFYRLSGLIT